MKWNVVRLHDRGEKAIVSRIRRCICFHRDDYIYEGEDYYTYSDETVISYLYGTSGLTGFTVGRLGLQQTYYYQRNLQGDITHIYDSEGVLKAKYEYDAWGNHEVILDTDGIGTLNPFRYRGYYYDVQTGLYYLKSRYYDSETGRFINADAIEILDETKDLINGLNLYAYCLNNPVMDIDPTGRLGFFAFLLALLLGGVISAGFEVASQIKQHGWNPGDWNWAEIGISALSGAVQGAIFAFTGGAGNLWLAIGIGALSGAAGNLVSQVGKNLVNGRKAFDNFNWGQFITSVVVGGIAGAASYGLTKFAQNTINRTNEAVKDAIHARVMSPAILSPTNPAIAGTYTVEFTAKVVAKVLPAALRAAMIGLSRLIF